MSEKLNIYQKMLQATMNIDRVKKGLTIEAGKTKDGRVRTYKAVSEADVLNAVKPIEIELGILSIPIKRNIVESAVLVNEYDKKSQFMRIDTTFRFINVDNPTEFVDVTTYGDGIDSGDKAPGKAMTYADKYALLKAYKIETGDDPDQEGSKEYTKVEKVEKPSPISQVQMDLIIKSVRDDAHLKQIKDYYGVAELTELTNTQGSTIINKLLQDKSKK